MIPGIQIVFHTIYIYEQKFNTVQTATTNNPLGPAEGQFCMSVYVLVFYTVQMYSESMTGTSLYTNDRCECSLACISLLKSLRTHEYSATNPSINNIIQVITLWEPASQHFLCDYCIFNTLVHSNSCILPSVLTYLINTEIKTNVTNALNKGWWHLTVLHRFHTWESRQSSNTQTSPRSPW